MKILNEFFSLRHFIWENFLPLQKVFLIYFSSFNEHEVIKNGKLLRKMATTWSKELFVNKLNIFKSKWIKDCIVQIEIAPKKKTFTILSTSSFSSSWCYQKSMSIDLYILFMSGNNDMKDIIYSMWMQCNFIGKILMSILWLTSKFSRL